LIRRDGETIGRHRPARGRARIIFDRHVHRVNRRAIGVDDLDVKARRRTAARPRQLERAGRLFRLRGREYGRRQQNGGQGLYATQHYDPL
jgi:hypothetical protein